MPHRLSWCGFDQNKYLCMCLRQWLCVYRRICSCVCARVVQLGISMHPSSYLYISVHTGVSLSNFTKKQVSYLFTF